MNLLHRSVAVPAVVQALSAPDRQQRVISPAPPFPHTKKTKPLDDALINCLGGHVAAGVVAILSAEVSCYFMVDRSQADYYSSSHDLFIGGSWAMVLNHPQVRPLWYR